MLMLLFSGLSGCGTGSSQPVPWGYSAQFDCTDGEGPGVMAATIYDDENVIESATYGRDDGSVVVSLVKIDNQTWGGAVELTTPCADYAAEDWYLLVLNIYGVSATDPNPGAAPPGAGETAG